MPTDTKTPMTAKEYLRRARTLDMHINALQEQLDRLWRLWLSASGPSYGTWTPHGSGVSNPTESRYLRIEALKAKINARIDELVDLKAEILDAIASVPDGTLQTLLTLYYVNCLPTWDAVAERMGYSRAHVVKVLHPAALRGVDAFLKDATQCYSDLC